MAGTAAGRAVPNRTGTRRRRTPWQVCQEPGQRRGLFVPCERVEHLRLNHLTTRDADQVQPVAGRGDGQVVHREQAVVAGLAVFAQREHVVEVGRDAADVLRVRVQRPEGHLHPQRPGGGGGQCPVRPRQAGPGGRRGEPAGEGAGGAGGRDGEQEVAPIQCLGGGGVDAGGQLYVWRDVPVVKRFAGQLADHVVGQDDLAGAVGHRLPGQHQQPLVALGDPRWRRGQHAPAIPHRIPTQSHLNGSRSGPAPRRAVTKPGQLVKPLASY
ncbi:hypothetical protein CcI6DRAFT_01303 [Frankia sp. CcI6]|nr:hypothetical protein CcI6DRAFT_01303 [Frankia sp. CcI6]